MATLANPLIQVEVEVIQQQDSNLRHQLTSESDTLNTLNNIRVPSLERDEETIEKVLFPISKSLNQVSETIIFV